MSAPESTDASRGQGEGPLVGRRILLGRLKEPDAIALALTEAGAHVDALALTVSLPLESPRLDQARTDLGGGAYAWVVLSSWRGARAVAPLLADAHARGTRIATVGAATARWIKDCGKVAPDLIGQGSAAALVRAFPPVTGNQRGRVLIPRSAIAPPNLPDGLSALGWSVDAVDAYTTRAATPGDIPTDLADAYRSGHFDALLLTASSQVPALLTLLGTPPPTTPVATIGAPTADMARRQGIGVAAHADSPEPDAVARALTDILSPTQGQQ